jgi:hypothetical protein
MVDISHNSADACLEAAEKMANGMAAAYEVEKDIRFTFAINPFAINQNTLFFRREMHRDEYARTFNHVIDISNAKWATDLQMHISQEIEAFKMLNDRRIAYDPENLACVEPKWSFDIHPITLALINISKTKNAPKLDRSHRLSGGFGRVVHYEVNKKSPLESLTFAYGNGVIRLEEARFKNEIFLQNTDPKEVPTLVIPEQYPESVMASFKGMRAEKLMDIFVGIRGMDRIRILDAQKEGQGTAFRFTNFLIPWELSEYNKASWRKTNLRM